MILFVDSWFTYVDDGNVNKKETKGFVKKDETTYGKNWNRKSNKYNNPQNGKGGRS